MAQFFWLPLFAGESGKLTREVWNGIEGTSVEDLRSLPSFHGGAQSVGLIDSSSVPSNAGDNFGERLRGYIIAPVSGDYTFWESGDDSVELLLSTDASKFNKAPIAWHGGWTGEQQWDKFITQQSESIRLEAGQKYYLELVHKDSAGTDHAAVAWAYTEVEVGVNLARLSGVSASQSSTYGAWTADAAIDGNTGGDAELGDPITHTQNEAGAWWQADLGALRSVDRLVLWNREGWNGRRLANFRLSLLDDAGELMISEDFFTDGTHAGQRFEWRLEGGINARSVRIELIGASVSGEHILQLAEVEVIGVELPQSASLVNLTQRAGVVASQSSTYSDWSAERAIDAITSGNAENGDLITHTQNEAGAWWQVDLGMPHFVENLVLWNRVGWNGRRLANFRVSLLGADGGVVLARDFFTDGSHAGEQLSWELPTRTRARSVKIERIGPSAGGENFLQLAEVEVFGQANRLEQVPRQLIDPAQLESYDIDPADLDDDDLLDSWELAHGFDSTTWQDGDYAYLSDSDGDHLINYEESQRGLNPFIRDSIQGFLTVEQRTDLPYYTLAEAETKSDKPYQDADSVWLSGESTTGEQYGWYLSHRMRGYVVAPVSGGYRFWISSTNDSRLLLSTGEDKYHKRVIAAMGPDYGTAHGIWFHSVFKWDTYASQMSDEVQLVAGQKYYLEVVHQHGHGHHPHASIAWAPPGMLREEIPASQLYHYHQTADDIDDDCLPDEWETAHNLSPTDNGLSDRARQGEKGDFDFDGLKNLDEYLLGTDPSLADTDGDGLSDFDETNSYGTNPLVSDASPEQLVANISPLTVSGLGVDWADTGTGVITSSFRGEGNWNFSVPSDGFWVVQVAATIRGDLRNEELVPVHVKIDGSYLSRQEIVFRNEAPGSLRIFTTYLTAGAHQLNLFIDNYTARRSVEITGILVLKPGGLDIDGNGYSDVIEKLLLTDNQVAAHTVVKSHVSPAFIEGRVRSLDLFELRAGQEDPGSTIRHKDSYWDQKISAIQAGLDAKLLGYITPPVDDHSPAGALISAHAGPGRGTWYAELALMANQATGYTAFFENGAFAQSGVVLWQPINLFDADEITIPAGSELLMSAWSKESDNSRLFFTIDGQEQEEIRAHDTLSYLFENSGDFTVSVDHDKSGETHTLTVHVEGADLPSGLSVAEDRARVVLLPDVGAHLTLDSGGEIGHDELRELPSGGSEVTLEGDFPGIHRMAVRMSETGAILDIEEVMVVGISDALRNLSDVATSIGEGMFRVRSPLLVTNLPPGATVKITIFAGGVTFLDGTTLKTFTVADFDENGVLILEFLMPTERLGAPCHYIEIFDAGGRQIYKN